MRFSRKKSVTITDNITIPSTVLTAKEYDQSIGGLSNPASKSPHFHDAEIAKSAQSAKLRMLSKRANKRKNKKSILKNSSSTSSTTTTTKEQTAKEKEVRDVKNSTTPKVSTSTYTNAAAAATMSITVNGKPILNIEPNATPEDVETFLSTLQCGLQSKSYELEQNQKKKKIVKDDEDDIQDNGILPTSTSETEVSLREEEDVEFNDILPTTTSETEASEEDGEVTLGPRATQKFEQMEKDMDAEVSLYDDKLGKSLRTLMEMKMKMGVCGPMAPEGEEDKKVIAHKAADSVEELASQVAQVVENVQETIVDASKDVESLIFPEASIQESSFEGTLSDRSWKQELNGYRLTGQTSDIRLNATNDDISVDPSIETIQNEGDIFIGFDQHVSSVVKEDKKKQRQNLVDPYQMSLMLDGVAVQSLTLGVTAMKMINDMISDAKGTVTICDVLNGGSEKELEIDIKNSLSVENEEVEVKTPPPEEQDSSFIHPLILEKLNSFVEQAMVNVEQAKTGFQKAVFATPGKDGEDNRNDALSFERSVSEDKRDYSIDDHINF